MRKIIILFLFAGSLSGQSYFFNKPEVNLDGLDYTIKRSSIPVGLKYINYVKPDLEVVFENILAAGSQALLNTIVSGTTTEIIPETQHLGVIVSTANETVIGSAQGQNIIFKSPVVFMEEDQATIGEEHRYRPYKIYVSSEIKIGNSIVIGSNYMRSTDLNDNILSVSTIAVKMNKKLEVQELYVSAEGLSSFGRGKFKNDIEIEETNRGLILLSTCSYKYLLWVDCNGNLFTTQISASPEISYEERVRRLDIDRQRKTYLRSEYKKVPKEKLRERLDLLEEYLGLNN